MRRGRGARFQVGVGSRLQHIARTQLFQSSRRGVVSYCSSTDSIDHVFKRPNWIHLMSDVSYLVDPVSEIMTQRSHPGLGDRGTPRDRRRSRLFRFRQHLRSTISGFRAVDVSASRSRVRTRVISPKRHACPASQSVFANETASFQRPLKAMSASTGFDRDTSFVAGGQKSNFDQSTDFIPTNFRAVQHFISLESSVRQISFFVHPCRVSSPCRVHCCDPSGIL